MKDRQVLLAAAGEEFARKYYVGANINNISLAASLAYQPVIRLVGVDVAAKRILWIKVRPDYEPLFAILEGLHKDGDLRFWKEPLEAQTNISDIREYNGQEGIGVKTFPQMSNNALTSAQENIK